MRGTCSSMTMNSGTRRFYQSNESFQLERGLKVAGREDEEEEEEGGGIRSNRARFIKGRARVQSIHARPAER